MVREVRGVMAGADRGRVCGAGGLGEREEREAAHGMCGQLYEGVCAGLGCFKNAAACEKIQRTGALQDAIAGMRGL